MKKVKIYQPAVREVRDGKSIKRVIDKKKGTYVKTMQVMPRTLELFENADDSYLINHNMYMEEVKEKKEDSASKHEPAPTKKTEGATDTPEPAVARKGMENPKTK